MENRNEIYVVEFVTSKRRQGVAVFATEEEAKNYADEKNSYYPICQKRKSFRVVKKDGTPKKWKNNISK